MAIDALSVELTVFVSLLYCILFTLVAMHLDAFLFKLNYFFFRGHHYAAATHGNCDYMLPSLVCTIRCVYSFFTVISFVFFIALHAVECYARNTEININGIDALVMRHADARDCFVSYTMVVNKIGVRFFR